jgi:dimethylglycine dehydrogenase
VEQRDHHYGFRRTLVDDVVAKECKAVRATAGIMDISAFTKVRLSGPDAAALLDRLTPTACPQNRWQSP